jgi:hypothetical protein
VNVDAAAFQALATQLSELAEQVRGIAKREFAEEMFFQAGFAAGQDDVRRSTGQPARVRAESARRAASPGHLRAVGTGAS